MKTVETGNSADRSVNIVPIKNLVIEKFSADSPVRATILGEKDSIKADALISKAETWLLLLRSSKL